MLTIYIPPHYELERKYILSVMLGEFLGLEYQVNIDSSKIDYEIVSNGSEHKLSIADRFFPVDTDNWLQPISLPEQPLNIWDIDRTSLSATTVNNRIPVIYGDDPEDPSFFARHEDNIYLGLDIFGSSFFMLTRYEEVIKKDRDALDRFPAIASLAYQEGFLDRPIVNEYLEIFWACLKLIFPHLERKQRQFATLVSHDLDEPFLFAHTGIPRLLQRCAGDLLKRRSPKALVGTLTNSFKVSVGNLTADPYNTFDRIMDISEANNLKSAFYFITDRTAGNIDGYYHMDLPLIRQLMRNMHDRGHEIGLHTSYHTYQDLHQTKKEFEVLRQACEREGIKQSTWGGRQHCLRWETPTTFQNWEDAGLNYDSTLTYAEKIGFRTGTCYQYSVFNILKRKHLHLQERPLCVMDVTITRPTYMGLSIADGTALSAVKIVKGRCRLFHGLFTLLWHNTSFVSSDDVALYQNIISA
jgi:peptidoglycan/xylan/chitin deacetylase (PgdA/CDA1 family)